MICTSVFGTLVIRYAKQELNSNSEKIRTQVLFSRPWFQPTTKAEGNTARMATSADRRKVFKALVKIGAPIKITKPWMTKDEMKVMNNASWIGCARCPNQIKRASKFKNPKRDSSVHWDEEKAEYMLTHDQSPYQGSSNRRIKLSGFSIRHDLLDQFEWIGTFAWF